MCAKQWVMLVDGPADQNGSYLGLKEPCAPSCWSQWSLDPTRVTQPAWRAQLPQSHVWAPVSHCLHGFE